MDFGVPTPPSLRVRVASANFSRPAGRKLFCWGYGKIGSRQPHPILKEGASSHLVTGFSFAEIDPLELFERLVLRAYGVFGCFPDPHFEPAIDVYCESPEDFAMDTVTKLLDPDDHSVTWNPARGGAPTMEGLLAYLERVMMNDFLDRKRSKRYQLHASLPPIESDDGAGVTLDELAVYLDTPQAIAIRHERHEHLIASFNDTPELQDILRVQLDPDGYNAYTNIEMAELLTTTVSDIENRKKRIYNRLLKRYQQQRATTL
jgi:DNA-directed RNA polymerase specialized sigma24 family protein